MRPPSRCSPCAMDSPASRNPPSNSTRPCRAARRSAERRRSAVHRVVRADLPDDPHRRAAVRQGCERELAGGHLRPLANIADAGSAQLRRILGLLRHADAVIAYFEAEERTLALEEHQGVFRSSMLCHVVEQFLHAPKPTLPYPFGY